MRAWWVSTLLLLGMTPAMSVPDARAQASFSGDRYLRCESRSGQPRLCPADTRGGVRLMRSLSKADCEEGSSWGVNDSGIWVKDDCRADFIIGYGGTPGGGVASRVVRCESRGNRWEHCDADTRGGAELVRQLSRNACMRGQNWGWDARGVWVSGGCRAEFRMMVAAADDRVPTKLVRCDSNDKLPRHCPADTSGGVRLYKQLSRSICVEGSSWGYDGNGIWVEDGCRAEFEVLFRDKQSGG